MSNKVLTKIKHRAKTVESKWTRGDRAALAVSAIGDELLRQSTTLVLENIDTDNGSVANPLIEEAASTIGGFDNAGNLAGQGGLGGTNSAMYRPLSLALARRVYPSLFAHKIVGVQPMAAPVGMAFAMRNYYSEIQAGKTVLGATEAAWENIPNYAGKGDKSDLAIGGGSITQEAFIAGIAYSTDAGAGTGTYTAPVAAVDAIAADYDVLNETAIPSATPITIAPLTGVSSGTAVLNGGVLYVNDATDQGLAEVARDAAITPAVPAAPATFKAVLVGDVYAGQTVIEAHFSTAVATSDAELLGVAAADGSETTGNTSGNFQEIGIKWDQKTISAKERPMAASFSLQSMQDIKALHEIDLKAEVMDTLQYESTAQLDRELLTALKTTSIDTGVNDEGHEVKGAEVLKVNLVQTGDADNRQMTAILVNSILFAANTVAKYTKRGKANFVVVSNKVATVLQAAVPFFTPITAAVDAGIILSGSESTEIGMINGFLTVYIDQFAKVDYALVGYKGEGKVSDSGVIFSPYIMGLKHEAIAQDNFQPRVGVTSRYAITTGLIDAGAYYRSLVFTGLDDVIIGTSATAGIGWN